MLAINNRQYLSVIATSGADIHVAVSWEDNAFGRGHAQTELTAITAISASPGTSVLAGPDSAQASKLVRTINIRNIDATSQTVTVCIVEADDAGTQTVYQIHKETIATGQELSFVEGAGWALATHNTLGVWDTMIAPADVPNVALDTLADFTGLTYAVVLGATYEFVARCYYTADATTTGSRWTVNGPAMTKINYASQYALTATSNTVNNAGAVQLPAAANATSLTVGNVALITGEFQPSAAGTFAVQFASEVAGGASITGLAGSTLMVRRIS